MKDAITVPMDVYDSPQEMVVILPLGGVKKESIHIQVTGLRLHITGERVGPTLKESLMSTHEQCFWGTFSKEIDVPSTVAFDRIWTELSPENILTVVIPKIITPEEIAVNIL